VREGEGGSVQELCKIQWESLRQGHFSGQVREKNYAQYPRRTGQGGAKEAAN